MPVFFCLVVSITTAVRTHVVTVIQLFLLFVSSASSSHKNPICGEMGKGAGRQRQGAPPGGVTGYNSSTTGCTVEHLVSGMVLYSCLTFIYTLIFF